MPSCKQGLGGGTRAGERRLSQGMIVMMMSSYWIRDSLIGESNDATMESVSLEEKRAR